MALTVYVRGGIIGEEEAAGSGLAYAVQQMIMASIESAAGSATNRPALQGLKAEIDFDIMSFSLVTVRDRLPQAIKELATALSAEKFQRKQWREVRDRISHELTLDRKNGAYQRDTLFRRAAYMWEPIRFPLRGDHTLFSALEREDLVSYYEKYYVTDNCIIILAGDIDTSETMRLANGMFGAMARKSAALPPRYESPEQTNPRWLETHADVTQSYVSVGFTTMEEGAQEGAVLDVLAAMLETRREEIARVLHLRSPDAADIAVSLLSPARSRRALVITYAADPQTAPGSARDLADWLTGLSSRKWDRDEISARAALMTTAFLGRRSDPAFVAGEVGRAVVRLGNPHFPATRAERWTMVTPESMRMVIKQYLHPSRLTTVILSPEPQLAGKEDVPARSILLDERSLIGTTMYPVRRIVLENGVTLIFRRNPHEPLVRFVFVSSGGLWCETAVNNGIFSMLGVSLSAGSMRSGREGYVSSCRSIGMTPEAVCGNQSFMLRGASPPEQAVRAASLLCEAWAEPMIDNEMLAFCRSRLIDKLSGLPTNIPEMVDFVFRESLFAVQPLRFNRYGTAANLKHFETRDIKALHTDFVSPRNSLLIVSGDVDEEQIRNEIERAFRNYRDTPKSEDFLRQSSRFEISTVQPYLTVRLPQEPARTGAYTRLYTSINPESIIVCGTQAPGYQNTNYPPVFTRLAQAALLGKLDQLGSEWKDSFGNRILTDYTAEEFTGYDVGWVYAYITVPASVTPDAKTRLQAVFRSACAELAAGGLLPVARRRALDEFALRSIDTGAVLEDIVRREMFGYPAAGKETFEAMIRACTEADCQRFTNEFARNPVTIMITPR